MKYKTILVDSHTLFREGLEKLIDENSCLEIVGSTDSGKTCIDLFHNNKIDLIIMDVQMADMSYFELIDQIKNDGCNKNCKFVILTESTNSSDVCDIYDLNANAYILKKVSYERFSPIVYSVLSGIDYFDPEVLPILNKELLIRNTNDSLLKKLTRREKQILICVAEGKSNKEIAVDCNISERTVKNHLSSIFQKIDVVDRTQAAVFAIRTNLIQI